MNNLIKSLCVVVALASPGAHAASVTVDNFTSFASQVSGIISYDFSAVDTSVGGSSFPVYTPTNPLTIPASSIIVAPEASGFVLDPIYFQPAQAPYGNIKFFTSQAGATNAISISPGSGVFAVGIYFGTYSGPPGGSLTVNVNGDDATGAPITFPPQVAAGTFTLAQTVNFVGVISSTAINTVIFTPGLNVPVSFDLTSVVTAVPEPSAALMFGVGLALLGAIGSRRRRA